jgi:cellulose synthase operon protein C
MKLILFALLCAPLWGQGSGAALRAEAAWKHGEYVAANDSFRAAVASEPANADYKVRWGRLFHERFQPGDAARLFEEALAINAEHPGAILGLALVAADSFDKQAVEWAEQAVKLDPKLVEGYELLARLALEDGNQKRARAQAAQALAVSPKSLDAMALCAAIDLLNGKTDSRWLDRIFAIDARFGRVYSGAARYFMLNRRYEESIALYRKAVERDPKLWAAHSELGVNLMRLGEEKEAREHLELAYNNDYRNAATVNSLRLLDSYKHFETIRSGNIILKVHKNEAALLAPYFEAEMRRAMKTYDRKYGFKLTRPVQVEVYPNHADFAVRTLGLPELGALGVTFGYVVAMDSPSARKPGSFNWASTLWHELSHVYVLAATKHRVPRWFTEGMAVHEETAISRDWGDRIDETVLAAVMEKKLLPVTQLDRGFIRPSYPAQVVVSYFQAGRICDFIKEKWGYAKLIDMMHDYAELKTTAEVIERQFALKPAEFDQQFLAWLGAQKLEIPPEVTPDGLKKLAASYQAAGKLPQAAATWQRLLYLYPFEEEPHRALGELDLELGRHAGAIREFAAAIAAGPIDRAGAYYNLARAYQAAGRKENSMEQVLLALETAPGFKPAQQLLLELSK